MKLTKRILVAVLSLVMLLTIVGAAFAEEYEAFDNYPHPRVKTDGSLTIGYISDKPEFESIQRILQQLRLECKHRGWNLIELYYENEQDLRDKFLNLINQDVDVNLNCLPYLRMSLSCESW